jgi:hypothetical protein
MSLSGPCESPLEAVLNRDVYDQCIAGPRREVKELLDRPWWRRAWIIQEAVVAQKLVLMCGPDTMEWGNVNSTIKKSSSYKNVIKVFDMTVVAKDKFTDDIYQIISSFRDKWATRNWDISIYELLYEYRKLECSWEHDRVIRLSWIGTRPGQYWYRPGLHFNSGGSIWTFCEDDD